MVTDSIGNFITSIKNGYMARKSHIIVPFTKTNLAIGLILVKEKYIESCVIVKQKNYKRLSLGLLYEQKRAALENLKRVSRPGCRIYVGKDAIPKVLSGKGKVILSTSKGIMTGQKAKKEHLGGEVLFKIW